MPPWLALALVALAAVLPLLAVRRRSAARRLVRLYHAQEKWASDMDCDRPRAA